MIVRTKSRTGSATAVSASDARQSRWALAALAFGAFVVGVAELAVVGLLNLVARDLGVSVSTAGALVTSYALGIAIGAPLLTVATTRFGRRSLLLGAVAAFVAGNVLVALSAGLGLLVVARAVTGSLHGLFVGVATVIAARVVTAERRGQAISLVFGGIMVSTLVGAPLGNVIGRALGWRAAFVAVAILGVVALAALLCVPRVPQDGVGRFREQATAALAPRVLGTLGVGLLLIGGQFTAFTYLVTFFDDVTGLPDSLDSVFLLIFGAAAVAGTVLGGRLADRGPLGAMIVAAVVLVIALVGLFVVGSSPWLTPVALVVWGTAGFAIVPPYQLRVISSAGAGSDLAATLGASAVNAGIALGALIGGATLAGPGARAIAVVAAIICALALPALVLLRAADRRAARRIA